MYKTQEGIEELNVLYELGLNLSKIEEKIFLMIWQDNTLTYQSISEKIDLSPEQVKSYGNYMCRKVENLIGEKKIRKLTLKRGVTSFLNKSSRVDDLQKTLSFGNSDQRVIQEVLDLIDRTQARITKDQEEIQSLAKETDELLNQLEYKAS